MSRMIDMDTIARVLSSLDRTQLHPPTLLAAATGMRRGELLALRWADVDFDNAILTVSRALQQTKAGLHPKSPKSGRGRQIALPKFATAALRAHKLRQLEERLAAGPSYVVNDLVFCRADGSFWPPDSFTGSFASAMRKSALSGFNFHALRHAHATVLLKAGVK